MFLRVMQRGLLDVWMDIFDKGGVSSCRAVGVVLVVLNNLKLLKESYERWVLHGSYSSEII